MLWRERARVARVLSSRPFWAGILLGAGGFQLFDGVVNHKLLRLHPVREGVENIIVYDAAWIASSLILLGAGWLMWRNAEGHAEEQAHLGGPRIRKRSGV